MKTALVGPTASGKSQIALEAVRAVRTRVRSGPEEVVGDIELISVDSMAVYRGLDIGTDKPSREDRARVPHHLLDLIPPNQPFSAGDYVREARPCLNTLWKTGKQPI